MITVAVNGTTEHHPDDATLDDLVVAHRSDRRGVAVARNDEIVPRHEWSTTRLAADDRIEILTAAQGG